MVIEEVTSYKTEDGRVFSEKRNAESHAIYLINEKKLIEAIKKVKQLFRKDLLLFAGVTEEYRANLEHDFWDDEGEALANDANIDITIDGFKDFVSLIKSLLENYHLEETIKIIKKTLYNEIKETSNDD